MKYYLFLLIGLSTFIAVSQNVQVDSQTYTPQQLIEDILIDSGCIDNVTVTNVVGGDFNNTDQSFGFFDASGSTFPLQSGIVMSTGRLQNVEGPNATLSDDDAPNWSGDNDLETILNEPNTTNATILEFDFTSIASQISFRYVFASEEYQEGSANTCQYSDLFGFLIRPANATQYTNIALVPNTQTPVKVTTVHPAIPNGCAAENEAYFESWNGPTAPINFNGQTKVLTATANVMPNETYHVKLVIADEQNYRYDSAVFLEAGSFVASTDLGPDRLLATNNPLCENDSLLLDAFNPNSTGYIWYRDGIPETPGYCSNCSDYLVTAPGTYSVDVQLGTDCVSYGNIVVEYSENPTVQNTTLIECDNNNDGLFYFNLNDAEQEVIIGAQDLYVSNYFLTQADASANTNAIDNNTITNFQNTVPNQIVYARVENQYGCSAVAEIELQASYNPYTFEPYTMCDGSTLDGVADFDLNDLENYLAPNFPAGAAITFYETEEDAFNNSNPIPNSYQNTVPYSQFIYVKVTENNQCITLSPLELQVLYTPVLEPDITTDNPVYYCLNSYPNTITLYGGVLNDLPNNYYYSWSNGDDASYTEVNEPGTYTVTVTDPNGCSSSRSITVVPSNIASIDNIEVTDASSNNSITVIVSGEGQYEFALDNSNGPYQASPFFENVTPGFHTVFVQDMNGCGIADELISVVGFPKFFTPNNDGYNDTWQVKGINDQFQPNTLIYIFDRHGKLLVELDPLGPGWNGTYKGRPLPSDDYWFSVTLQDGRAYNNHFTLKR